MNKNTSEQIDLPNGVGGLIISSNQRIALVSKNRPSQGKTTKEIPAVSLFDPRKSKMETLIETLTEEYHIRRSDIVATYHKPFKEFHRLEGQSNATMTLYTILIDGETNKDLDSIEWVTFREFTKYVDDGLIVDAKTLFAYEYYLYIFKDHLKTMENLRKGR